MNYMLMFYEPETEFAKRNDPAEAGPYWGAWSAYVGALNAAGIVKSGEGLMPPATSTTVRIRGSERLVQDGPIAGVKEQLGGFFVIDVPDLDTALAWAARSPNASVGGTEVRPVLPPPSQA
jgi:hypothetical protein